MAIRAIIFIITFFILYSCQKEAIVRIDPLSISNNLSVEDLKYVFINEVLPKWIGGSNQELVRLIQSQLKYPSEDCIVGITVLSFIVDEMGKVQAPVIRRSISKKIDEQLTRIIQIYRFEPGRAFNGTIVPFQMNFPIKIRLD